MKKYTLELLQREAQMLFSNLEYSSHSNEEKTEIINNFIELVYKTGSNDTLIRLNSGQYEKPKNNS